MRCGADWTCNDGRGHGRYLYRYDRYDRENGKLTSAYLGKARLTRGTMPDLGQESLSDHDYKEWLDTPGRKCLGDRIILLSCELILA